jgi:hypothetical protein
MWRLLLLLTLPFTSCYAYQFFTLKSDHLQENTKHEYVLENDTLKIIYNFNGQDCPVTLSFHNKTSKPLIIDWKKSAIIINDTATSYYSNVYEIQATENGTHFNHVYAGNLSGNIYGNSEEGFIPPNATITKDPVRIKVRAVGPNKFNNQKKVETPNQVPVKFQEKEFDKQNTPFQFRSYLTLKFQGEDKEFFIDNAFYVTRVKLTKAVPAWSSDNSGNTFYIKISQ